MRKKLFLMTITAMLLLCTANPGLARIWYVNVDYYPEIGGDGTNWTLAFNNLKTALVAAAPNDEIWVATPDSDDIIDLTLDPYNSLPLLVDKPIGLYGGFVGGEFSKEARDPYKRSVIEGKHSVDHCLIIATGAANAIIDGFAIGGGGQDVSPFEGQGGGIYIEGADPTIQNCKIWKNKAELGGGIYSYNSKPLLKNCYIADNEAKKGAGLYSTSSTMTVEDCLIRSNEAIPENGEGGGLYSQASKAFLRDSQFEFNISELNGGAIYSYGSEVSCKNTLFQKNRSYQGAIYLAFCPEVTFDKCDFKLNGFGEIDLLAGKGAAIHNRESQVFISECNFTENQSDYGGGAIYAEWVGNSLIQDSNFNRNMTTRWLGRDDYEQGGGAILQKGQVLIRNCRFSSNKVAVQDAADLGVRPSEVFDTKGGAVRNMPSELGYTFKNCTFSDNQAYYGGAIFDSDDNSKIIDCSFDENWATRGGALMFERDDSQETASQAFLANSVFQFNLAHEDGGAVYNDSSDMIIAHCTFTENECNYYGGAAYFTGNNGSLGTHVVNSIFWENNSESIACAKEISSSLERNINPTYCDIDNDDVNCPTPPYLTYEGNIQERPLFGRGVHIGSISPCRDAGTSVVPFSWSLLSQDFEGDPRKAGTEPDMGADEFLLHPEIDVMPGLCPNTIKVEKNNPHAVEIEAAIVNLSQLDAGPIDVSTVKLVYRGFELSPKDVRFRDISQRVDDPENICDCPQRGGDGEIDLVFKFVLPEELIDEIDRTVKVVLSIEGETTLDEPFLGRDCLMFKVVKPRLR